jgi:Cd2+/Zn2+-exporting ATPase
VARLAPNEVLMHKDGVQRLVSVDEVGVGEIVVVRPGKRLAIDGKIIEGETTVNEAPVTGEGVPVGERAGRYGILRKPQRLRRVAGSRRPKAEDPTLQRFTHLVEEA